MQPPTHPMKLVGKSNSLSSFTTGTNASPTHWFEFHSDVCATEKVSIIGPFISYFGMAAIFIKLLSQLQTLIPHQTSHVALNKKTLATELSSFRLYEAPEKVLPTTIENSKSFFAAGFSITICRFVYRKVSQRSSTFRRWNLISFEWSRLPSPSA